MQSCCRWTIQNAEWASLNAESRELRVPWHGIDSEAKSKFSDPDVMVRRWVVQEHHFPLGPGHLYFDIAASDKDPQVRLFALAKCEYTASKGTRQALLSALSDEEALVRTLALGAIRLHADSWTPPISREDLPQLSTLLHDKNAHVRLKALALLCKVEPLPEEATLLIDALGTKVDKLEQPVNASAIPPYHGYRLTQANDRNERQVVIGEAARALGQMKPRPMAAVPALQTLVLEGSRSNRGRAAAAVALVRLESKSDAALGALREAVERGDWRVARSLSTLPLSAAELSLLIDIALNHNSDMVLLNTALALNELEPQSERFERAIAKLVLSDAMRKDIWHKFKDLPVSISLPIARAALSDSRVEVRLHAAFCLADDYPDTPTLFETLVEFLSYEGLGRGEVRLRRESCLLLGRIGNPKARPLLDQALQDADKEVRRAAAFGIEFLDHPKVLEMWDRLVELRGRAHVRLQKRAFTKVRYRTAAQPPLEMDVSKVRSVRMPLSLPRFQSTLTQKTGVFGCFAARGRHLTAMVWCNSN